MRIPGPINSNTTLIDFGYVDVAGAGGVYLVQAEKSCLIDSGTRSGAPRIIKALKQLDAFPPDYIILTHSHWDHCQGVPILRQRALKEQKAIEVFAHTEAIPLLEDQSFNNVFDQKGSFQNIKDVTPLSEGNTVDLGGISLKIYHTPGHISDHISILDERNKNIFVGDAIGMKAGDNAYLPPILPPFCNKKDFHSTIQKLKNIDYNTISLCHFGCIIDNEAKTVLDEAEHVFNQMWEIFSKAHSEGKLDDQDFIYTTAMREINPIIPEFKLLKPEIRIMLGVMNGLRRLIRKDPISTANIMIKDVLAWQVLGFKLANNIS